MAKPLIVTKLIKSVRDRSMIPTDTSTYSDEDILDILNEEMDVGLLNVVMSLNEEHFVTKVDVTIDATISGAVIPERAIGNKLRDVSYIEGDSVYELSRISLEELSDYRGNVNQHGQDVFYIEGDELRLVNSSTSSQTLRMYFYLRPNNLVLEKDCARITSIDKITGRVIISDFPKSFSGVTKFDFVQSRSPNKILAYDIDDTARDATLKFIDFNPSDLPDRLRVGDYVCEESTTPFANIPTELHPLLAQRAACFILEALGDTEGLQNSLRKMAQMENSLQTILNDRVDGAPQKINSRHTPLKQANSYTGAIKGRRKR